jgi:hypothetical protein
MKKQYVGIGVLVLVVIVTGWYFVGSKEPKAAPVVTPAPVTPAATTTGVATSIEPAQTTPDEIELDLSKLQGKDRLYTEEEGKYENLGEEEQKLLTHLPCMINQAETLNNCVPESGDFISGGIHRLLALQNDHAVVWYSSESGAPSTIRVYDLETLEQLDQFRDSDVVFGEHYMIRWRNTPNDPPVEYLELYRPGMSQFITIPSSRLTAGTYKKMSESDMLPDTLQIDLSGDLLVAHVFSYKYSEDAERMYDQQITPRYKFYELVSENTRTFNIANLQ